jgi:hypothetical protein
MVSRMAAEASAASAASKKNLDLFQMMARYADYLLYQ